MPEFLEATGQKRRTEKLLAWHWNLWGRENEAKEKPAWMEMKQQTPNVWEWKRSGRMIFWEKIDGAGGFQAPVRDPGHHFGVPHLHV